MCHNAAALCLAGLLIGCASTPSNAPTSRADTATEALINRSEVVAVVSSVDVAVDLEQTALRWGYALKRKEALGGLGLWILTFDCPPGIDPRVASLELERLQPRSTVEANHKYLLQSAKPSPDILSVRAPRVYANELIDWPAEGCDAAISVGMIDGAIRETEFRNTNAKITSRSFVPGQPSQAAQDHGTAVAELLIGKGRLRNAKLYSAAVVAEDADGVTYSGVEPMLKALDWLVTQDVRLINVSLAGPYNETLAQGFDRASDQGVIIVAAVGNEGPTSKPRYPAALPSVIAATAVDSERNVYSQAVQGRHVDVAAPGVDVYIPGEDGGRYISGTSIAAPFVTASLATSARPNDRRLVKDIRSSIPKMVQDLGDKGRDPVFGDGMIKTSGRCGG